MPTILRFGGYRVLIFTEDHGPAHVHVIGHGAEYIFLLNCPHGPVALRGRQEGTESEFRKIARALNQKLDILCKAWEELHGEK